MRDVLYGIYMVAMSLLMFAIICLGMLTLGKLISKECSFKNGDLVCEVKLV